MRALRPILLLLLLALSPALGGCAGVLVVGGLGAAAGGGYAAAQERGVDGTVNDYATRAEISHVLAMKDPAMHAGITTTVYQGRVLLTGRLASPAQKRMADWLVSNTKGVRAVYDEIEVAPPDDMWNAASDTWIATRIRSGLVFDTDVRSTNYLVEVANGSAYLLGSARSQAELDRAVQIARTVPGVKRVVSYVELRPGVPATAAAPLEPGPAGPPGAAAPPSRQPAPPASRSGGTGTSGEAIQVEKL